MSKYIILHRIRADADFPQPVVIRADSIIAVGPDQDDTGNTRIYFAPRSFWTVGEDEQTVLISLGFFDDTDDATRVARIAELP